MGEPSRVDSVLIGDFFGILRVGATWETPKSRLASPWNHIGKICASHVNHQCMVVLIGNGLKPHDIAQG